MIKIKEQLSVSPVNLAVEEHPE